MIARWAFCVMAIASAPQLGACVLKPLPEQLQLPELQVSVPQYAMSGYRSELLRFVAGDYARIAADLLRGDGDYLDALHVLMGSGDNSCTDEYRELLLQKNRQEFALALWQKRIAE